MTEQTDFFFPKVAPASVVHAELLAARTPGALFCSPSSFTQGSGHQSPSPDQFYLFSTIRIHTLLPVSIVPGLVQPNRMANSWLEARRSEGVECG